MKNLVKQYGFALVLVGLMSLEPCFAVEIDTDPLENMNRIKEIIKSIGIVVATCGLLYGGYKIIFKGANIMDVAGPVIGCIVVGAASFIATRLLG